MKPARLSSAAVAILAALSDDWAPPSSPDVVRSAAWRELAAADLVLERVWPPPLPGAHHASRRARELAGPGLPRETQVMRTLRGRERLERIRRLPRGSLS